MVTNKLFSTAIYLVASFAISSGSTFGYSGAYSSRASYAPAEYNHKYYSKTYTYARGSYEPLMQSGYLSKYSRNYQSRSYTAPTAGYSYQDSLQEKADAPAAKEGNYRLDYSVDYLKSSEYSKQYRTLSCSMGATAVPENRVRVETIKSIEWQWENNPISVLKAMQAWQHDWDLALAKLKAGQAGNKSAQRLYVVAAATLPDFWDLVFYAANSEPRFGELQSALIWQSRNDVSSLSRSWDAWKANQEIQAYYYLLWGQRNDPKALNIYRACWSRNREEVMSKVAQLVKS